MTLDDAPLKAACENQHLDRRHQGSDAATGRRVLTAPTMRLLPHLQETALQKDGRLSRGESCTFMFRGGIYTSYNAAAVPFHCQLPQCYKQGSPTRR